MNELTLSELLRVGESEHTKEYADFLILKIEGATPEPEVIINHRRNFEAKLEYISKAYNEDLTLKNAPHIRIVNYDFVTAKQLVEDNILLVW